MTDKPQLQNLKPYKQKADFIRQTAQQVIKDFAMEGLEVEFSGHIPTAYDELCEQVQPLIASLLERNMPKFANLLYRIDLPEKQVNAIIHGQEGANAIAAITDLILERELKKVVVREFFRGR